MSSADSLAAQTALVFYVENALITYLYDAANELLLDYAEFAECGAESTAQVRNVGLALIAIIRVLRETYAGSNGGDSVKQRFQSFDFRIPTLGRIKTINDIIAQYAAQGYRLTLRQVYYQHVARGMIPNNEREYKKLGSILNDGRLAGLIDWDSIEDRTRTLRGLPSWDDPSGIIASAYHSFKLDRWDRQPNRVEVWIEKDALIGVIERTCQRHDVNFFSCRGYVSQSEMYVAAQRLQGYIDAGQDVHVLHLGDHDPSGIDMTRDIESRLTLFLDGLNCNMNRLALNIDQVQQYSPPPNPAKMTDSRFAAYIHRFGKSSWELDALDPSVLDSLIETEIENLRDPDIWDETLEEEKHHKDLLRDTSRRWKEVAAFLEA